MHIPKKEFDRLFKLVPRLAVDAVVTKGGKILLTERMIEPNKGAMCLPGGFVDRGETTEHAIVREVFEETGVRAKIISLIGVYSDPKRDPRGHIVSVSYLMRATSGAPRGSDETKNVAFHDIKHIPRLGFDHNKIVRDALRLMKGKKTKLSF